MATKSDLTLTLDHKFSDCRHYAHLCAEVPSSRPRPRLSPPAHAARRWPPRPSPDDDNAIRKLASSYLFRGPMWKRRGCKE